MENNKVIEIWSFHDDCKIMETDFDNKVYRVLDELERKVNLISIKIKGTCEDCKQYSDRLYEGLCPQCQQSRADCLYEQYLEKLEDIECGDVTI